MRMQSRALRAALLAMLWGGATVLPAAAQHGPPPPPPPVVPLDPALPSYTPGPPVSGRLEGASGMDSVEQMFAAWVKAFRQSHPGADLSIVQKDLAPEERIGLGPDVAEVFDPNPDAYADKYGYEPFRIRVCQGAFSLKSHVSAIGVFVSKANPLNAISLAQLDAVYSDARRRGYPHDIATWGQLGLTGAWANRPIHIYGFYWRDDVAWYFRDLVDYGAPFKFDYGPPGTDMKRRTPAVAADIMTALAADPAAIAYANFSYASDQVKPLALIDGHGRLSVPTQAEAASGRYPLQRSIYIYVNRRPGQPLSPLLKEFFTFVLSREGQALVQPTDHYLPLTAAMAAVERAKLQ